MMKKEELWKDIPNYEGIYQVSDLGRVKSLKFGKERILKPSTDKNNDLVVILSNKNIKKAYRINKLVKFLFDKSGLYWKEYKPTRRNRKLGNFTSEYKGVSFDKNSNKWRASIFINGALINLGIFTSEYDAHLAYQAKLSQI